MTTIEIQDDTYEFLKGFMKNINSQNNRDAKSPYIYTIRDIHRVYGVEDDSLVDGWVWYNINDGSVYDTDEKLLESLDNDDNLCIEDLATVNGYEYTPYSESRMITNIFFTEKSANEHLKQYHYHYNDPDIYVKSLVVNDEMIDVLYAIGEIVGDALILQ